MLLLIIFLEGPTFFVFSLAELQDCKIFYFEPHLKPLNASLRHSSDKIVKVLQQLLMIGQNFMSTVEQQS